MIQDLSAAELRDAMNTISRINLEIQREHLPYKKWEESLSKSLCWFQSRNDSVQDSGHASLPSNHLQMLDFARKSERDTAIRALHDRLMKMPCLFPEASRLSLRFGLTEAGNAAIDIRIDGISVHERPVTAATLAPKLTEIAKCLARCPEPADPDHSVRRFMVAHVDRMTAVSPGQAVWKWICLRHRKVALRILNTPGNPSLPESEEFKKLLTGLTVREVFDTGPELAQALHLTCPEELSDGENMHW